MPLPHRGSAAEGRGRLEGARRQAHRACRGARRGRAEARLAQPRLRIRDARRRLAPDRRTDRGAGVYYEPDIGWIARGGRRHPHRTRQVPRQDRRLPRQGHRAGGRHQGRRLDRRRFRHHRLEGAVAVDRAIRAATSSSSRTTIRPTGAASRAFLQVPLRSHRQQEGLINGAGRKHRHHRLRQHLGHLLHARAAVQRPEDRRLRRHRRRRSPRRGPSNTASRRSPSTSCWRTTRSTW